MSGRIAIELFVLFIARRMVSLFSHWYLTVPYDYGGWVGETGLVNRHERQTDSGIKPHFIRYRNTKHPAQKPNPLSNAAKAANKPITLLPATGLTQTNKTAPTVETIKPTN